VRTEVKDSSATRATCAELTEAITSSADLGIDSLGVMEVVADSKTS